jgi:hypothetical protein
MNQFFALFLMYENLFHSYFVKLYTKKIECKSYLYLKNLFSTYVKFEN